MKEDLNDNGFEIVGINSVGNDLFFMITEKKSIYRFNQLKGI